MLYTRTSILDFDSTDNPHFFSPYLILAMHAGALKRLGLGNLDSTDFRSQVVRKMEVRLYIVEFNIKYFNWVHSTIISKIHLLFKDVVSCSGFKKSIFFFTYFESIIYREYTVKSLDWNMKYLRSYST